ncbi:MAG: type II toxin-antitoxin system RelE/ParE family toxin [Pseudomonadota bacterium]
MNWRVIFYRSASGRCPIEEFVEDLPVEDAKEVIASIAALRELGNKARRPLADYLEDGIYELRARRLKKQFRVLYTFAGRQIILLLTGFVKKSKAVPAPKIKKAKALKNDYLKRAKGDKNG